LLKAIAASDTFKKATVKGIPPDRMADRETVLRFFAFVLTDPYSYNEPEFDSFLSSRMKNLNEASEEQRAQLSRRFFLALTRGQLIFEKHAFRKYKNPKKRQPINKAIMEAWLVALDRISADDFLELYQNRTETLLSKWLDLNSNRDFENAVSQGTGDPKKVHLRFKAIESLVKETLND